MFRANGFLEQLSKDNFDVAKNYAEILVNTYAVITEKSEADFLEAFRYRYKNDTSFAELMAGNAVKAQNNDFRGIADNPYIMLIPGSDALPNYPYLGYVEMHIRKFIRMGIEPILVGVTSFLRKAMHEKYWHGSLISHYVAAGMRQENIHLLVDDAIYDDFVSRYYSGLKSLQY